MSPAEQEAGNAKPLDEMLALEPFLELDLAAGRAIVPDCQDAVLRGYLPATTMISTL
jgi:hypothetical protein